jgi:hypothetical protein
MLRRAGIGGSPIKFLIITEIFSLVVLYIVFHMFLLLHYYTASMARILQVWLAYCKYVLHTASMVCILQVWITYYKHSLPTASTAHLL